MMPRVFCLRIWILRSCAPILLRCLTKKAWVGSFAWRRRKPVVPILIFALGYAASRVLILRRFTGYKMVRSTTYRVVLIAYLSRVLLQGALRSCTTSAHAHKSAGTRMTHLAYPPCWRAFLHSRRFFPYGLRTAHL